MFAVQKRTKSDSTYDALKNMLNSKYPGNDGLTKELFLSLWDGISSILFKVLFGSLLL